MPNNKRHAARGRGTNSKKGTPQVTPPTPKQRVNSAFGSKEALVDEIMQLIGESDGDAKRRLMKVSNLRLMSHHRNATRMVNEFGSRDGVVSAILQLRFPKGPSDEHVEAKLRSYSPWRLMDEVRQARDLAAKAEKQAAVEAKARAARKKRRTKVKARRAARIAAQH